ncbi:MAG: hypothetical protein K2Y40_12375 [Reyranella sp.]|nr:hypothetical protein [Reyranella sp.]
MAVSFFFANPSWQANGTVNWWFDVGDRDNFWSVSVRPFQANDRVRLEGGIDSISDNNLKQRTEFRVTMTASGGGGLVKLTAIRVTP